MKNLKFYANELRCQKPEPCSGLQNLSIGNYSLNREKIEILSSELRYLKLKPYLDMQERAFSNHREKPSDFLFGSKITLMIIY